MQGSISGGNRVQVRVVKGGQIQHVKTFTLFDRIDSPEFTGWDTELRDDGFGALVHDDGTAQLFRDEDGEPVLVGVGKWRKQ